MEAQTQLIAPQTAWFHVFKHMIESGDAAKLGPYAMFVYLVIKAYTNWKTGKAWPGIDLIVQKTGISRGKVISSLKVLEEHGYLEKKKVWKNNQYVLKEKITFNDEEGRPQAVAAWDYLPTTIGDAVSEIRNFVSTSGTGSDFKIIHIEHLTLNVQQNFGGDGHRMNTTNIDAGGIDKILALPDDNPLKRAFLKSRGKE